MFSVSDLRSVFRRFWPPCYFRCFSVYFVYFRVKRQKNPRLNAETVKTVKTVKTVNLMTEPAVLRGPKHRYWHLLTPWWQNPWHRDTEPRILLAFYTKLTVFNVFHTGAQKRCRKRVFVVIVINAPRNGRVMDLLSFNETPKTHRKHRKVMNTRKVMNLTVLTVLTDVPSVTAGFDTVWHGFGHCDTVSNPSKPRFKPVTSGKTR